MAKTKAVVIRAGSFATREELVALVQPFDFGAAYGSEVKEKAKIKELLGWPSAPREAGKFYGLDGPDAHKWYFFAYGGGPDSTVNKAMLQACKKTVKGDVVVVKSGPMQAMMGLGYDEWMTVDEVVDAIMQYQHLDPSQVFAQREAKRAFGPAAAGVPSVHIPLDPGTGMSHATMAFASDKGLAAGLRAAWKASGTTTAATAAAAAAAAAPTRKRAAAKKPASNADGAAGGAVAASSGVQGQSAQGQPQPGQGCQLCGKAVESLKKCGRCRTVAYCGVECQRADWKTHKAACVAPP